MKYRIDIYGDEKHKHYMCLTCGYETKVKNKNRAQKEE